MNKLTRNLSLAGVISSALLVSACSLVNDVTASFSNNQQAIGQAVANVERTEKEIARDIYRNPTETLAFFDVKATDTVVEISPGGGWYTNILAPLLADNGKLYAAHFFIEEDTRDWYKRSRANFEKKVAEYPPYNAITVTDFAADKDVDVAPVGTADAVLTFRNVHNWYMGNGDDSIIGAFATFHKALKSGGILGVVEHRLPETADDADMQRSGYMKQSYVIKMAEKAGFTLVAASEVNANSKDTANHPKGVWTLPPRLALGEEKQDHYLSIGESDRMTLKFVKQ